MFILPENSNPLKSSTYRWNKAPGKLKNMEQMEQKFSSKRLELNQNPEMAGTYKKKRGRQGWRNV